MSDAARFFDGWAFNGRAELMQREHSRPVRHFLSGVRTSVPFRFLDVGCGNGWVVRRMAGLDCCRAAVGIDISVNMIKNARAKRRTDRETYIVADIEKWRTLRRFDYVFSMEVIYYTVSPERALGRIFKLLKPGGTLHCGMDFYADNEATAGWSEKMGLRMHLLSRREWKNLFMDAGFKVKSTMIRDDADGKKWKREMGTLFVTGTRPAA